MRFWAKLLLLLAPFLVAFGVPAIVLCAAGEFASIDRVVARQQGAEPGLLYGPRYVEIEKPLKLKAALALKPDVLAVGSSRTMQFRAGCFREPGRFYNAGGTARWLWHFREFLTLLPNKPSLVLLCLDHREFNADYNPVAYTARAPFPVAMPDPLHTIQWHWSQVYQDWAAGKYTLGQIAAARWSGDRVGLWAVSYQSGFRADGSRRYPPLAADVAERCQEDMRRMRKGDGFEPGAHVDPARVAIVDELLAYCHDQGIFAAGFLPPYSHQMWVEMQESGRFGFLPEIAPSLRPVFARHNFPFGDYSDVAWLGTPDSEVLDGHHGSEKTYLRMVLDLARSDTRLGRWVDTGALERLLASARDDLSVFGD